MEIWLPIYKSCNKKEREIDVFLHLSIYLSICNCWSHKLFSLHPSPFRREEANLFIFKQLKVMTPRDSLVKNEDTCGKEGLESMGRYLLLQFTYWSAFFEYWTRGEKKKLMKSWHFGDGKSCLLETIQLVKDMSLLCIKWIPKEVPGLGYRIKEIQWEESAVRGGSREITGKGWTLGVSGNHAMKIQPPHYFNLLTGE